jgi:phosphatidylserine/phosphatidylglycerophosphate/cardiolipin synthase-like enzyme
MSILNTPSGMDTYILPDDDTAAKAAVIALIASAKTKIRLAMYTLTDPNLIDEISKAATRGITDILIALDESEAHRSYERRAISTLRTQLGTPRMAFTQSSARNMIMHQKVCTIDDTTVISGSTNWTTEGWIESNTLTIVRNAPLAQYHSKNIEALAAFGTAHIPQA